MKPVVPDAARVSDKWVRRAGQASTDYGEGVERSPKDQAGNAVAAKTLFAQRVSDSKTHDLWEKNLRAAGTEAFKRGVREKGTQRYGPGVQAAQPKFGGRIGGILSAISGVDIPARGVPASDQNFQRSRLIGQALNRLKGSFSR